MFHPLFIAVAQRAARVAISSAIGTPDVAEAPAPNRITGSISDCLTMAVSCSVLMCRILRILNFSISLSHAGHSHIDRGVAVHPAGKRFRAAMFYDWSMSHFAVPQPVRHLYRRVLTFIFHLVQSDPLVSVFNVTFVALSIPQPGARFLQAIHPVSLRRPRVPVVVAVGPPPFSGVAGSPISWRDAEGMALNGSVLSTVCLGGPCRNRTCNLTIKSRLLCLVELTARN